MVGGGAGNRAFCNAATASSSTFALPLDLLTPTDARVPSGAILNSTSTTPVS